MSVEQSKIAVYIELAKSVLTVLDTIVEEAEAFGGPELKAALSTVVLSAKDFVGYLAYTATEDRKVEDVKALYDTYQSDLQHLLNL